MLIRKRNPLEPVGGTETPEEVVVHRRRWLKLAGIGVGIGASALGAIGYQTWRRLQGSDEEVTSPRVTSTDYEQRLANVFPARREAQFQYGRAETERAEAARY